MDVRMPDGTIVKNVPDNITQEELLSRYEASKQTSSAGSRFLKGAISDPITGLAQAAYNALPQGVQNAGNRLNNALADYGLTARIPEGGLNELVRQQEAEYERAAPKGFDAARVAGNIFSPVNLLPAAGLTRAASATGRVLQGAGLGAAGGLMNPVTNQNYGEGVQENLLLGALTGGALSGAGEGVARVVSPRASVNPDVKAMREMGVEITPGQALGGVAGKIEEKLTSVPFMGDMISRRRGEAVEKFNQSMFEKAGRPIGFKTQQTGFNAISEFDTAIGDAYKKAVEATPSVRVDEGFLNRAVSLSQMADEAADLGATKQALDKQIDLLLSKVTKNGQILPDTWKQLDSKLGEAARKTKNPEFRDAVRQLQVEWRDMAGRSNPKQRELFKKADSAYANLIRLEKAAESASKGEGVFSPNQLYRAARSAASSKTSVRQKSAPFMQDAMQAERVLGNTVPNSGTVDRALAGGGLVAGVMSNPLLAMLPGIGAAMYSSPVNRFLTSAVSSRPQFAQPLAQSISQSSPILGLLGGQAIE